MPYSAYMYFHIHLELFFESCFSSLVIIIHVYLVLRNSAELDMKKEEWLNRCSRYCL
jgi:Flp pilus assembly protein protease CpaA